MKYRSNVAAILRNPRGQILVCERINNRGAWQFPQGSVDHGETLEEALGRELWEEIGVEQNDFRVVECRGPYRYDFSGGKTKKGYHGKVQHYFLCDYFAADSRINVNTDDPEFRDFRWIKPEEFEKRWLPEMKRDVYRAVLWDFFGIEI